MTIALDWIRFKKLTDLRVHVLYKQTHIHKPNRWDFMPINKPTGLKIDPNPYISVL